jgi:uncharacterized membrane protein
VENLLFKLATENGLTVAFAVFCMSMLFLMLKWLWKNVEEMQKTEKEKQKQFFEMMNSYYVAINSLTQKIETLNSCNIRDHSFQKKEHEEIIRNLK